MLISFISALVPLIYVPCISTLSDLLVSIRTNVPPINIHSLGLPQRIQCAHQPCRHRILNRKGYPRHNPYHQSLVLTQARTPYRSRVRSRTFSTCSKKEDIDHLAELYNEHKECLDQTKLTHDLERPRAYACLHRVYFAYKLSPALQ